MREMDLPATGGQRVKSVDLLSPPFSIGHFFSGLTGKPDMVETKAIFVFQFNWDTKTSG
jgi:hypothetical protein